MPKQRSVIATSGFVLLLSVCTLCCVSFAVAADITEEDRHAAAIRKAAGGERSESESLPIGIDGGGDHDVGEGGGEASNAEEVAFDQYYDEDPRNQRLHERLRASKSIGIAVEEEIKAMSSSVNSLEDEGRRVTRTSHLTDIVNKYNHCMEDKGRAEQERGGLQQDLSRCTSELTMLKPDEINCRQELHRTTSALDTCNQDLTAAGIKVNHLEIRNRQCVKQLDQRVRDTHNVEKELTSKAAVDSASRQEVQRLHEAVEGLSRELTETHAEIDRLETDKHELVKQMGRMQEELKGLREDADPSTATRHKPHPGHQPAHHAAHQQRRQYKDIAVKNEERYAHLDGTPSTDAPVVDDETHNRRRASDEDAVSKLRAEVKQRATEEREARDRQHNHKQYSKSHSL